MKPLKSTHSARILGGSLVALLTAWAGPVQAGTGTWTGGALANWDTTATNWSGVSGTPWDSTNGPSNTAAFG